MQEKPFLKGNLNVYLCSYANKKSIVVDIQKWHFSKSTYVTHISKRNFILSVWKLLKNKLGGRALYIFF